MKVAIEALLGCFIIVIMAVFSVSFLTASADIRNAQNFHASVITELEASDFSATVMDACIENANDNGYVKKNVDGTISPGLEIGAETNGSRKVTLTYSYSMPFLNEFLDHTIVGYAKDFY